MEDWKPCDALTPADFDRHPLWGYDAERAENDPDSDDAWVRPYVLDAEPKESDVLFARAKLRMSGGDAVPGAVLFVFEEGRPKVGGFALLALSVATHVTASHCGGLAALRDGSAPSVRFVADATATYFEHLALAAVLWIAATAFWVARLLPAWLGRP